MAENKSECLPDHTWKFSELENYMVFYFEKTPNALYRKINDKEAITANDSFFNGIKTKVSGNRKVKTDWDTLGVTTNG